MVQKIDHFIALQAAVSILSKFCEVNLSLIFKKLHNIFLDFNNTIYLSSFKSLSSWKWPLSAVNSCSKSHPLKMLMRILPVLLKIAWCVQFCYWKVILLLLCIILLFAKNHTNCFLHYFFHCFWEIRKIRYWAAIFNH